MENRLRENPTESDLIRVVSLPVIEERLRTLKPQIEEEVNEALSLACTEETVQAVKAKRAELNKLFSELEEQRKAVKTKIMAPYNVFEAVYKECVTDALKSADESLKGKISAVEEEQKRRCEEDLRDYFAELVAVHHVEWLAYERAGIKVDMASAKSKTPKKLREQLVAFVARVSDDVNRISSLDASAEIMVEYQKSFDAADAICTVQERHRRIEEQEAAREAAKEEMEREREAVRKVEAFAAPVPVEVPKEYKCTFTVVTTMEKLKALKNFMEKEGISYE